MSPQAKPGEGRSNKRRRELARAKEARQEARRAERERIQRRRTLMVAGLAALAVVVVALGFALWPDSSSDSTASTSTSPTPSATASLANCTEAPSANPSPQQYQKAPKGQLESGTKYTLTLKTNCGKIVIQTLPKLAPKTVNSMLWLAQQGYFNNTPCHRLTTSGIFVLQCGDPTGAGTGSPGYTVPDENLPKQAENNYPAGTIAMANAGAGTSGSQFFIVYEDTSLPGSYTIWGKVTKGLDIVKEVAAAGVAGGGTDGAPNQPIGIITATPDPQLPS